MNYISPDLSLGYYHPVVLCTVYHVHPMNVIVRKIPNVLVHIVLYVLDGGMVLLVVVIIVHQRWKMIHMEWIIVRLFGAMIYLQWSVR